MRSALAALSLCGVLPLLGFASALLWMQWQTRLEENRRELRQIARTLAVAIDRELDGSIRQLEGIAEMPLLAPQSLERFHAYGRRLVTGRPGWDNLTLFEPDGSQRANSALAFGDRLPPREDIPYRTVFDAGVPTVTDLFESQRTRQAGAAVLVPVRRDDGIRWVLGARLSSAHLGDLLRSTFARPDALAAIMDGSGRIVARTRAQDAFVGQPAPASFLRLAATSRSGVGRAVTLEGVEMLVAWERLERGWTVAHAVPLDAAEAPLRRSMQLLAGFAAALLVAVFAVSLATSRRIGGAVDAAARDADRLAAEQSLAGRRSAIVEVDRLFGAHQRASRALAVARSDRTRAIEDLQHATERLREAVERRDQFLAMLAHELRNPLAPLVNALHLMSRRGRLDATDAELRDMGERQVRQLARLVDDLLDISRVATGKIRLLSAPMSLATAVRDAAEAARPEIASHDQRLVVDVPPEADPAIVVGDRARIAQLLHNLLGNAAKFGRPGGTVRLALRVAGGEAVVTVADDGVGIDRSRLGELFEPFNQIDPALDRANGGLGLGLAMVRQLAAMHGGSAEVESAGLGHGATFTVRIPLAGTA